MKLQKIKETLDGKLITASIVMSNALTPLNVGATGNLEAWNSGNANGTTFVDGFVTVIAKLATYGGAMYAAGAVFALILAMRNEDTEGRNKAILNLLAAVGLLSMGGIMNLFFGDAVSIK